MLLDLLVRPVLLVQDQQVLQVQLDQLDSRVIKELLVLQVEDLQVLLVHKDRWDKLVLLVKLALQVQVLLVPLDLLVLLDLVAGQPVLLVIPDQLVQPDQLVLLARQAEQVPLVQQVIKVLPVLWDQLV